MKKFLKQAAETIINNGFTGINSVVILPNRRSEVFLKEEIKNLNKTNIWLPEFYPVDEFIQKVSGLKKADNITTSFELYNVYAKIEGNKAKTIDDFLTWAPVILSDFNDIDNSLADAKAIYEQLSAIKAIQAWNPDGRPLTELQRNYLHFFNSMYQYYIELSSVLIPKGIGYQGLISKYLLENISSLSHNLKWNNYLFVGINALSEAELQIIDHINQIYNTDFIWDVDDFYFGKTVLQHEAGKHIQHIINRLKIPPPEIVEKRLTETKKNIRILGVPKSIGQVKFIGQELSRNSRNYINQDNKSENLNTAIVLGNEQLVIPLLHSLPFSTLNNNTPIPYNLTLGYPLKNSQIDHFFSTWADIIISLNNNKGIKTNELINMLSSPFVKHLLHNDSWLCEVIIKNLITNNISFVTFEDLKELLSIEKRDLYQKLLNIISYNSTNSISTTLDELKITLIEGVKETKNKNILIHEQLQTLIKILGKLTDLAKNNENILNFTALKKVGKQLIGQSNIDLVGEPLRGIQIMGMLETRTLDFDNIYILSVNEGVLPKTSNIDSFIPFDIRRENKLPLPSDNSDIYAYHFFRLLQRGTNITLVYNSDTDKLGGGEKSRFILQIENELSKINPKLDLICKTISTNISKSVNKESSIEIVKTQEILKRIEDISKTGYSASLFNSFITCPLKFYFSQLSRLNTTASTEQSIEANTFGTIVHEALEIIYKPFLGKEIDVASVRKSLNNRKVITSIFNKYYKNGNISYGKNLLIFEVANNTINNFVNWDIKNLKKAPSILLSAEKKISKDIIVKGNAIKFKGVIDRVDSIISTGTIKIIDYKTGGVETKDLIINSTQDLFIDPKFAKAFQVTYYAWLFNPQNKNDNIETGIISTRNISRGFIPLVLKQFSSVNEYFGEFENSIFNLIREISDPDIPFVQTPDNKRCTWCDYKSICNR